MARDYYDVLGIPKSASQDDIKKAFRKKAHELHPDKGGDEKAFKEVNEAYQILGNEGRRKTYDQFGHSAFQNGGAGAGGFGGFGGQGFDGVNINFDDLGDLGDVIGNMFGFGGGKSARKRRGRDLETVVNLEFIEAFQGVSKQVTLRLQAACESCNGSGTAEGSKTVTCSECNGQGRVVRAQRTPFGTFQSAVACTKCHGSGSVPETPCATCNGNGVTQQTKVLQVDIPAGIADGETIRMTGLGEAVPHGAAGDLFVHVRVSKHASFERHGNDIVITAYVPMSAFLLGGNVDIETMEGMVELKVPSGTQSGTLFKLRGKGFPYLHGHGRGDQLVTLYPDIPRKITREQKRLLEELKNLGL